ncbi:WG containing repeat-containing protein [Prevotella sp. tc2-28]|uniref:WG repeat-containing protein n=1 Tax=Prevotella sp. tc2-28 TaxID=1761888 RepID=UPI00089B6C72|nr:WG repeat-containing protein [Prevotella sp. tc2-28]SEA89132.1 WG containing repeat-containing protein [Prevotella sp. tc2-28]
MKQKRTFMMVILSLVFVICGFAQSQTQIPVEKIAKLFAQGYSYCGEFHDGMAKIQRNGKYGYINKDGDLVVQCIYKEAKDFSDGIALVAIERMQDVEDVESEEKGTGNQKYIVDKTVIKKELVTLWGMIDKTGKSVLQCEYNDIQKYTSDFYVTIVIPNKLPRKWRYGAVDRNGKNIIPIIYENIVCFRLSSEEPMATEAPVVVWKKDGDSSSCALFNTKGNVIVPFGKYGGIGTYKNSYYIIRDKTIGCGLLDKNAKIIFPASMCNDVFEYDEIIYAEIDKSKYKVAVKGGAQILPEVFDDYDKREGFMEFKKGNESFYITPNGVKLPKSKYPNYRFEKYKNGHYIVKSDKGYAIMDSYGKITSAFYKKIHRITDDGFAVVENESKKWGVIDFKGNIIFPFKYNRFSIAECKVDNKDYVYHPINNYMVVSEFGKNGKSNSALFDKQGNIVIPFREMEGGYTFKNNGDILYRIIWGGKCGLLTKEGKELLPMIYDEIGNRCDGLIPVKKDGVWGYADENGHSTFDYKFENVKNEQIEAKPAQKENKPQVKEKKKKSKFLNFINKVMEEGKKQQ